MKYREGRRGSGWEGGHILLDGISELLPQLQVDNIGGVEGDDGLGKLNELVQEHGVLLIKLPQSLSY